jgi:hypothetical protein
MGLGARRFVPVGGQPHHKMGRMGCMGPPIMTTMKTRSNSSHSFLAFCPKERAALPEITLTLLIYRNRSAQRCQTNC